MSKARTVKIAISLPEELLHAVEGECRTRGETRSRLFRQAIERLLRQQHAQEAVKRYVEGYQKQPETDEEITLAHQLGTAVLTQEPWS
jgi:metal-responsive CopG/Arc/MetJ family transcriptional regulator